MFCVHYDLVKGISRIGSEDERAKKTATIFDDVINFDQISLPKYENFLCNNYRNGTKRH